MIYLQNIDTMENLTGQYLLQSFVVGIVISLLSVISISLNLAVQKKYKSRPSFVLNLLQGFVYVFSVGIVGFSDVYIVKNYFVHLPHSPINILALIIGFTLAFLAVILVVKKRNTRK
jgi:drug/metabolite transporter (DMT)-like permease